MVEAEQGVGEAVNSPEAAKAEARELLASGESLEAVQAATGLSRNQVLGISGAMKKAQKRAKIQEGPQSDSLGKADGEEETLGADLKKEAALTNNAVTLARASARLRNLDPKLYNAIHGSGEQPESSPSKTLIDLEVLREIKAMRASEEGVQHRNDGDATTEMKREIAGLREEMHKKDVDALKQQTDDLKQEIKELRLDIRGSTSSQSDLAVVFRETSNLLGKVLESPGVLRSYLLPDANIKSVGEAPQLHAQPQSRGFIDALREHGLVTRIVQKEGPA